MFWGSKNDSDLVFWEGFAINCWKGSFILLLVLWPRPRLRKWIFMTKIKRKFSSSSWIVFLQHCRWCKRDSFSCWEASFLDRFCALFPRVTIKTVRLPLSALVPLLQVRPLYACLPCPQVVPLSTNSPRLAWLTESYLLFEIQEAL